MAVQLPYYMELRPGHGSRRSKFTIVASVLSIIFIFLIFSHPPATSKDSFASRLKWYDQTSDNIAPDVPLLRDLDHPGKVVLSPDRITDVTDSFANFTRHPWCTLSSLELHDPFAPLCPDIQSLLLALSGGGRAGVDMPYQPRGCDMRWFSTAEICVILSRFSYIHVIGDSMMRNLAVAMHTLVREDLYDGPWLQWTIPSNGVDCSCSGPFNSGKCIFNAAFSSRIIYENDPASMACPRENSALIEYNTQTTYPLNHDVDGLISELPTAKPSKPHVFVIGHGIWNSLNETATSLLLDEITTAINTTMPWLTEPAAIYPKLFVTPSASGDNKPVQFQDTQGNVALRRFETNMGPLVREKGFDHLGVFNLTLQNTTPDGTHAGMRSNLVKAMMVLNWLNHLDTSAY